MGRRRHDLYNTLVSSQGKRETPITIIITGVGRGSVGWELYAYAKRVESGEVVDPTFLPVLFEVAPETGWRDRRVPAARAPGLALSQRRPLPTRG